MKINHTVSHTLLMMINRSVCGTSLLMIINMVCDTVWLEIADVVLVQEASTQRRAFDEFDGACE